MSHLITNLDEGVISKSHDGISFCNDFGFKVLENILHITNKGPNMSELSSLTNSLKENAFLFGILDKKDKKQKKREKIIMKTKYFEV